MGVRIRYICVNKGWRRKYVVLRIFLEGLLVVEVREAFGRWREGLGIFAVCRFRFRGLLRLF